jgi:flagellar M-ring protein FliF
MAVTHLIASAVEGLAPESVFVLDMRGNLLNRPRRLTSSLGDGGAADEMLETRQRLEKDLVAKISSTLEPLLGAEKFRAGASVDCDFTSSEESEESYDPNKSVMLTSQVTEDASTAKTTAGVPGTASNLPRPAARPATAPSGVSRHTENITYQSSRLVRQRRFPQGTVKKMSLAVLVDHNVKWQGEGEKKQRFPAPPSPETMKAIHDLVAAATGLSSERGDQLIVESLPFESTLNFEPLAPARPVTPASPQTQLLGLWNKNKYLVIGAGGAVLLLLLLMVFCMIRRKKRAGLKGMVSS